MIFSGPLNNSDTLAKKRRNMNLALDFPTRPHGLEGAIARFHEWMANPDSPVRAIRHQPARAGDFVGFPEALAPPLKQALVSRGIRQLYTHQAEAFEHALDRNVVVVTPTASGKTLCYNLPILNRLIQDPAARALYLFPTKALAEDQLHEFQSALDAMRS